MITFLPKSSWREFKTVVALHLKGDLKHWDSNISRKIFDILHTEEIRERFLSGFSNVRVFTSEKLDLSLDEIINPIRFLEEKSHKRGCHAGRLTLNPQEYHRSITGNDSLAPNYLRAGFLSTPWGNHRLLDVSEDIKNPVRASLKKKDAEEINWGLQDVYFLGGLPLIYWTKGNAIGMKVLTKPLMQDIKTPRGNLPVNVRQNFQWRSLEESSEYTRMWYLPTERETHGAKIPDNWIPRRFLHQKEPRTYLSNQAWIDRHTGGKTPVDGLLDNSNDIYINYIQIIEDITIAEKSGIPEDFILTDEKCQMKTLGGW